MKITKTKLREMIKEELNEISGVAGGSANIERLKKLASAARQKMTTTKQKVRGKGFKAATKQKADSAYTDAVADYDTKAADYTKQAEKKK